MASAVQMFAELVIMTVIEAQIESEMTLPYVSQLANMLESYNDLTDLETLSVDQIAELLVTLKRASDFAQAETAVH